MWRAGDTADSGAQPADGRPGPYLRSLAAVPTPGPSTRTPASGPRPGTVSGEEPGRDRVIVEMFDGHYTGLCRLASLLLDDRAAAEEVVQEAFLRTFAGWRRIRQPERAQWYLRAAVVNLCRSRLRRRVTEDRGNRAATLDAGRVLGHLVGRGAADEPGRPADTEQTGEVLAVLAAVRSLPPRQREAVVLRYYQDLSEADIAATLGCSPGTVKSQLAKARATLGRLLAEPTGPGSDAHGPAGAAPPHPVGVTDAGAVEEAADIRREHDA